MTKRTIQKARMFFGGITVASLFFSSCYNEVKESLEDGDIPIRITTDILPPTTRVTDENFETKDAIGFFLLTNTDKLNEAYFKNTPFTFQKETDFIPTKELYYPKTQDPSQIISYFPYQKDILTDEGLLKVCIVDKASEKAEPTIVDFLIAKKEEVFADLKPQELSFKHTLAKIEIEIKPSQGYTPEEILSTKPLLKIHNQSTQALFDAQKEIFSQHSNKQDLQPKANWKIEEGIIKGCSFLYIPKEISPTDEFITIQAEHITYKCSFPKNWSVTPGTINRLTINYTPSKGIAIAKAESDITPWKEGNKIEINSQIETNAIQTSLFDFKNTAVYQLVNAQGIPKAQVCRELLINKEVKTEAIVIYPVDKELRIGHKGVCLKSFDQEGSLMGDTIVWDKKDNSFSIVQRKEEAINAYFFINTQGEICFSRPKNCELIHLEEEYLSPNNTSEKNQYPIVKIGTQYWTQRNWKEELNSNGKPFAFEADKFIINAGYSTSKFIAGEYFYNRAAVESDLVSPQGWAIPKTEEWRMLSKYIQNDYNLLKSGQWKNGVPSVPNTQLSIISVGVFANTGYKTGSTGYWAYNPTDKNKLTAMLFHNLPELDPLEIRPIDSNDYQLNIRLIKR